MKNVLLLLILLLSLSCSRERDAYVHRSCGFTTVMGRKIAETYARNPKFYGATYCTACKMHRPVGEFYWEKQFHTDLEVTLGD